MKLHSIHFKNINCLAGEWTIDFDNPALASDGIFVLSGPTGAGKSSVLDAITLALFGQTARQNKVSSGASEVMTNGMTSCFAEAVFTGADGVRYRSRWSQDCVRHRDGTLDFQTPDMTIVRVDTGEDLTPHRLQDAKAFVADKVGFAFPDFIRTVLLEQGRFDEFLHAREEDRAAILEKATDTSQFSALGARINDRAKEEKRKASERKAVVEALRKLVAQARDPSELEAEAAAHDAAAKAAGIRADALRKEAAWLKEEDTIANEETAVANEEAELDNRQPALDAARAAIAASDKARALLPDRAAAKEKENAAQNAARTLNAAEADKRRLDAALPVADQKAKESTNALEAARKALADAAQPLTDARRLDREVELARQALTTSSAAVIPLRTAFDNAVHLTAKARKDVANAGQAVEDATAAVDNAKKRTEALVPLRKASETAEAAKAAAEQAASDAAKKFDDETKPAANERLDSLREKQLLATTLKSLEDHRKELRRGKPCPLCGAIDHPYADGLPDGLPTPDDVKREIDRETNALNAAQRAVTSLERKAADARKKADEARKALQQAENTAQQATARADADLKAARARQATLAGTVPAAEKVEADARDALGKAVAAETAAKADLDRKTDARARIPFPDADAYEKGLRERIDEAEKAANAARTALVRAQTQATGAADNVRKAKEDLDAANQARDEALAAFATRLAKEGFASEEAWRGACLSDAARTAAERTRDNFARDKDTLVGRRQALVARKKEHAASPDRPEAIRDARDVAAELAAATEDQTKETAAAAALRATIAAQETNRGNLDQAEKNAAAQEETADKWNRLDAVLGGPGGKAFRLYAQGRNLRTLLDAASPRLEEMSHGDYRFEWDPATGTLEPLVRDRHFEKPRPVSNLSGGESFLASLALALSFSNFNAKRAPIGTLFLDEGFGTLDPAALDRALDVLADLRDTGRQVGLVTHVAQVKERVPAHIAVEKLGNGRSALHGPGVTENIAAADAVAKPRRRRANRREGGDSRAD